jgi:hypothetical protein
VDNLVTTRQVIHILASQQNSRPRFSAAVVHPVGKPVSEEGDWKSCPQSFPHLLITWIDPPFEAIFIAWCRRQSAMASLFALLSDGILSTSMIVWKSVSEKTENPVATMTAEGWTLRVSKGVPLHTETWPCRISSCG